MFADRHEAGRKLAEAVAGLDLLDPLVLALPRGGVPVAYEVAKRLGAPLDLLVVRKLGAPGHRELALGAIVGGAAPQTVFNEEVVSVMRPSPEYLEGEIAAQRAELARRRRAYTGDRPEPDVAGRTVVLVDDGVATGASARAALLGLKQAGAGRVVLAVPVGPPEVLEQLGEVADEVVCPLAPHRFRAVGEWYGDFRQTEDEEVVALLAQAKRTETRVRPLRSGGLQS